MAIWHQERHFCYGNSYRDRENPMLLAERTLPSFAAQTFSDPGAAEALSDTPRQV